MSGKKDGSEKKDEDKPKTSLFGNTAPPAEAKKTGSLFGGLPSGGSLFGGNTNGSGGSLFGNGNKQGTTSLFGGGTLFGNTNTTGGSLFGNPTGDKPQGSLFATGNSLFGNQTSIFSKPKENKEGDDKDDGSDNGVYKNEDEPPTVVLEDQTAQDSPFTKVFEREVTKFKQATPVDQKKNCGGGKVSIQKGTFGEDKKSVIYKVIFKNNIGKTLYDSNISGTFSKLRKIEEKAFKNQLKIAVCQINKATNKNTVYYCLVNFNRNDDLEQFTTHFKDAVADLQSQQKAK